MPPFPKTYVRPIRIHLPPDETGTRTVRGVGFRAVCDCSWRGPTQPSYAEARKDLRAHKGWHAGVLPLSMAGPL
jgi:hypothetical protein